MAVTFFVLILVGILNGTPANSTPFPQPFDTLEACDAAAHDVLDKAKPQDHFVLECREYDLVLEHTT